MKPYLLVTITLSAAVAAAGQGACKINDNVALVSYIIYAEVRGLLIRIPKVHGEISDEGPLNRYDLYNNSTCCMVDSQLVY